MWKYRTVFDLVQAKQKHERKILQLDRYFYTAIILPFRKAPATQGGRQLNILFGCNASLHRIKGKRKKHSIECEKSAGIRNERCMFFAGRFGSNSSNWKKNDTKFGARKWKMHQTNSSECAFKVHSKHEHWGSKIHFSMANEIFFYLFLLSYSNHSAASALVWPWWWWRRQYMAMCFCVSFCSVCSASFLFGSKFYAFFVLGGLECRWCGFRCKKDLSFQPICFFLALVLLAFFSLLVTPFIFFCILTMDWTQRQEMHILRCRSMGRKKLFSIAKVVVVVCCWFTLFIMRLFWFLVAIVVVVIRLLLHFDSYLHFVWFGHCYFVVFYSGNDTPKFLFCSQQIKYEKVTAFSLVDFPCSIQMQCEGKKCMEFVTTERNACEIY